MEYWKNLSLENIIYIDKDGCKKEESWKEIPKCEGIYMASDLGRLKSLPRRYINKGNIAHRKGNILKGYINSQGYRCVNIVFYKNISVHLLVSFAFHNHKRCGYDFVVDHLDDNKLNNCADNLKIVTSRENTMRGHKNTSSKYTGVSLCKRSNRFFTIITIKRKQIALGYQKLEEDAKNLYDTAFKLKGNYNGNNKEFRKLIKSYV